MGVRAALSSTTEPSCAADVRTDDTAIAHVRGKNVVVKMLLLLHCELLGITRQWCLGVQDSLMSSSASRSQTCEVWAATSERHARVSVYEPDAWAAKCDYVWHEMRQCCWLEAYCSPMTVTILVTNFFESPSSCCGYS